MAMISGRMPKVVVEYSNGRQRVSKEFTDAFAARRFYVAKLAQGAAPTVKAAK